MLHERSTKGQFTRSIGHEILWFTVTVISLTDEGRLYEMDKVTLQFQIQILHGSLLTEKNTIYIQGMLKY